MIKLWYDKSNSFSRIRVSPKLNALLIIYYVKIISCINMLAVMSDTFAN